MSVQQHPSIVIRTIGVVLLLWLALAVIAWNAADTLPIPTSTSKTTSAPLAKTAVAKSTIEAVHPQQPAAVKPDEGPKDLTTAIQSRHSNAVLRLVTDSKQIQLADEHGDTPLHYAVRNALPQLVQLLLIHDADPYQRNAAGLLPIQLMPRGKHQSSHYTPKQRDVLDRFIDHHRNPAQGKARAKAKVQAVFNYAARHGEFEAAEAAIAQGAEPTATLGRTQRTLLHLNLNPRHVERYLALGVPIGARDKDGRTALSLAVFKNRHSLAKSLLEAGAKISKVAGKTDLANAVNFGKSNGPALTQLLLEHGAVASQSEWMTAISSQDPNVIKQLMRQSGGFDPKTVDGANRIKSAQQQTGGRVLKAMRSDPRIDAYVKSQPARNQAQRTKDLAGFSSWLGPHMLSLVAIVTLLACFALVPISLVNKGMGLSMYVGGISAALFVHLFLFNQSVETALGEFRLFGEPTQALRIGLMIFGDGIAFAIGAGIGVIWSQLPKHRQDSIGLRPRAAGIVLYLACFGLLIGHNLGSIEWPTKVYRSISGYDAYIEGKTEEAKQAKRIRNAEYAVHKLRDKKNQPPYTALFAVIKANDKEALKVAIASQVDINIQDKKGATAVHKTMYPPRPLMLQTLIDAGASLDITADRGYSPVHYLVDTNFSDKSLPVLELLLKAGANTSTIDERGNTPLCLALTLRKTRLGQIAVKLLLSAGADINPEPNCAPVAITKHEGLLKWLVKQGAKVDALRPDVYLSNKHGSYLASALWSAAYNGNPKRCQELINLGADIELRDTKFGSTPLHAALSNRHRDASKARAVAELLIASGADITSIAWDGRSTSDFDKQDQLPTLLASTSEVSGLYR